MYIQRLVRVGEVGAVASVRRRRVGRDGAVRLGDVGRGRVNLRLRCTARGGGRTEREEKIDANQHHAIMNTGGRGGDAKKNKQAVGEQ